MEPNDINDMTRRMEESLRIAMERHIKKGGINAIFARLMLAVVPAWASALAWENSRATSVDDIKDIVLASSNVLANLMSSTFKTIFAESEDSSEWKNLVIEAYDQAFRSGNTMSFDVPKNKRN
jgi:hypothetical protein